MNGAKRAAITVSSNTPPNHQRGSRCTVCTICVNHFAALDGWASLNRDSSLNFVGTAILTPYRDGCVDQAEHSRYQRVDLPPYRKAPRAARRLERQDSLLKECLK